MKNLEKEYRKAFDEEMPDLWGRIEANLPAKKVRRFPVNRYASVAAAAVFLALLIPGSLFLMNGSSKSSERNMMDTAEPKFFANTNDMAENSKGMEEELEMAQADTAARDSMEEMVAEENSMDFAEGTCNLQAETNSGGAAAPDKVGAEERFTVLEYWDVEGGRIYTLKNVNRNVSAFLSDEMMEELSKDDLVPEMDGNYLFTFTDSSTQDFTYRIIGVK